MTRYIVLVFLISVLILNACTPDQPDMVPSSTVQSTKVSATKTLKPTATEPGETSTPEETPENISETPDKHTESATPTEAIEIEPSGPENYPSSYNPLTGLPVSDRDVLDQRPVAVKIQLYPRSGRPPWGVSLADIVYDYYQNDGLTRLNAIFYTNDSEQVGPIRSARIFDEHLMRMYKTIFAFGGADWRVFNRIYDADLRDLMVVEGAHNCPPMCRIEPNAANYLVTNTEDLRSYIEENGVDNDRQELNGMSFDSQVPDSGESGEAIELRWSISAYVKWVFDPESGKYVRYQDTSESGARSSEQFESFTDRLNGEAITADNVIVIPLPHVNLYPQNKYEIIDIQLPAGESGTAYAFRDGNMYEVEWNRPEADSVLYLTFKDGTDYPFKPGNTWFEIMGKTSYIEEVEEGIWRYEFRY